MRIDTRRVPPIAASAALWIWCAILNYAMLTEVDDLTLTTFTFTASRSALITQALGLVVFLVTMFVAYPTRFVPTIFRLSYPQIAIFAVMYLSFALQLHGDEIAVLTGIFYTTLLLVTSLGFAVLWTMEPEDFERCVTVAAMVLCSFGVLAIALYGWPQGRMVGAIQPNGFATPLLAGFILTQFGAGRTGIVVRVLCFALVTVVSSRYAMIGCVAAMAAFGLTYRPLARWSMPALLVALLAGMLFWSHIAELLALDDSTRGLASGFSGRDDRWQMALEGITDNPFGVGFKRSIGEEAGHNGYLKTILEFGIPGGTLIILCIAGLVGTAAVEAINAGRKPLRQHRFECARFGGLAAVLFGAFFQPQIFSLGDALAITLLLVMFKPRTASRSAVAPVVGTAHPARS